jgi:hypothetical protein
MRLVGFLLAGVLGMALSVVKADQATTCVDYEEAKDAALKAAATDPTATFMDFGDEQAQAIVKAINAEPPPSDLKAERVLVLERGKGQCRNRTRSRWLLAGRELFQKRNGAN